MFKIRKVFLSSVLKFSTEVQRIIGAAKPFYDIPGPYSFPVIGTMPHYFRLLGKYDIKDLLSTYQNMNMQYGDLVREKCNYFRTLVHVYDPEDIMAVYNSDGILPRRNSHNAIAKYRMDRPHLYSGPGIVSSNGEEWKEFRDLFYRAFVNVKVAGMVSDAVDEVTNDLVEAISRNLNQQQETDLLHLLFRWGLETISYICMDQRLGCLSKEGYSEAQALIKATDETQEAVLMTEAMGDFFQSFQTKTLERAQVVLEKCVLSQFDVFFAMKDWQERNCLVAKLMQCKGADKKKIFTILMDAYVAGIDSTTYVLGFMLYNLACNVEAQQKLREELMKSLPRPDSKLSDSKNPLKYLFLCYKESLRLNPVAVANGRVLNRDLVLQGYLVPKDTTVILQHMVACRSERNYSNALQYIPERWEDEDCRSDVYKPFGFGHRSCVGSLIAERQLLICLSKIIRNFELSYHHEPVGIRCKLLNVPDKDIYLRFKRIYQ